MSEGIRAAGQTDGIYLARYVLACILDGESLGKLGCRVDLPMEQIRLPSCLFVKENKIR